MKTFRDYLTESAQQASHPSVGDAFDIELAPDELAEGYVIESTNDRITIVLSESAIDALERRGALSERIARYGAVGSDRGQGFTVAEGLSEIDIERQDWERMSPQEFQRAHGKTKEQWQVEYDRMFNRLQGQTQKALQRTEKKDVDYCDACDRPSNRCVCEDILEGYPYGQHKPKRGECPECGTVGGHEEDCARHPENKKQQSKEPKKKQGVTEDNFLQRVMELAGCGRKMKEEANTSDPLADKVAALAPVGAIGDEQPATTIDEGVMKGIAAELGEIADTEDYDALYDLMTSTSPAGQMVQKIADEIAINHHLYDDDHEELLDRVMDRLIDDFGGQLDEAEYQGRKVELNKPKRGGSKKFYVYVKDPKSGNVRKISFGDPNMKIKKSNPARRKSFRARHNCSTAKDKTSAQYWACRAW